MKVQLFSLLVIAVTYASLTYRPTAEEQAEPGYIDFASLHGQANSALALLQTSQARRAVPVEIIAAF